MNILTNVVWQFNEVDSVTIEEFNEEFTLYQKDILEDNACWNPEKIVIDNSDVGIKYSAWLRGAEEIASNERVLEKTGFFENGDNKDSDGLFQVDIFAKLNADNQNNFTALELMYKLNLQMSLKNLGDKVCFEGLYEYQSDEGFPCFVMRCGS